MNTQDVGLPFESHSPGPGFRGRRTLIRGMLGVFLLIAPAACNLTHPAPDRMSRVTTPGVSSGQTPVIPPLPAEVNRLRKQVLAWMRAGKDPEGLSEAGRWRVDRGGRIDLVVHVQGPLTRLVHWIRDHGGRMSAVVPRAKECEAWVPAGQVVHLARQPGVVLIQFPHYAMTRD